MTPFTQWNSEQMSDSWVSFNWIKRENKTKGMVNHFRLATCSTPSLPPSLPAAPGKDV